MIINNFRTLSDSIKVDVKTEINKNLHDALKIIDNMKNSFSDRLKKEGEKYLAGLEKDMLEKTTVLKKIESIVSCVSELSTLYK